MSVFNHRTGTAHTVSQPPYNFIRSFVRFSNAVKPTETKANNMFVLKTVVCNGDDWKKCIIQTD